LLGLFPSAGDEKVRTVYDRARRRGATRRARPRRSDPNFKGRGGERGYAGAGVTYDLYRNDSSETRSMIGHAIGSNVHYGENFDNAFGMVNRWSMAMVRQLFNRFTIAIDVIGHELTHGVTSFHPARLSGPVRRTQ